VIAWLGSTRGLTVLLVASLGANLFLGGMVAGRIAGDVTQGSQTRRSIQAMLAALPDAKRELVRREINAVMPQVREQLAALQKARAALAEEMVKPAPDSGALDRGFAAVQFHTMAIGAELQRAILRALPGLSQEERRALVRALARRQSGGALPLP
jgi:uncharacterized membrane protein